MQYGTCKVRLSGELNNEILKSGVTPAEILLLRQVHGVDAVHQVSAKGTDKRPHREEVERLSNTYGAKVVAAAFPGLNPQLPVTFKDIGVDAVSVAGVDVAKPPRKQRVALGEAAPAAAGDAGGDEGGDDEQGGGDE